MGELSPLPSTYDLVSHHRAEERDIVTPLWVMAI
jgi:hypothetical protein